MIPRAKLLLIALIALCSAALSACAAAERPPLLAETVYCPQPHRPQLPRLDNALPLDHIANVKPLLLRDDVLRQYISGLEDTLTCYQKQVRDVGENK